MISPKGRDDPSKFISSRKLLWCRWRQFPARSKHFRSQLQSHYAHNSEAHNKSNDGVKRGVVTIKRSLASNDHQSVHSLDHCCSAVESPVAVVAVAFSSLAARRTLSPPGSLLVSNASSLSLASHVLFSASLTPHHAQEEQRTWAN